jgi:hypothetical protein
MNPILEPLKPLSAFSAWLFDYGFGVLEVEDATTLHFAEVWDGDGGVMDQFTLVQTAHGPRSLPTP